MRFTGRVNGERLAALRGKRSRSLIAFELQKRGHMTDTKTIWRWENGRNQPGGAVLMDYADVLGASSVEELYGDDEEEEAALSPLTPDEYALYGLLTARLIAGASEPKARRATRKVAA